MGRIKSNDGDRKYYGWYEHSTDLDKIELFRYIKTYIRSCFHNPVIYDLGCGVGYVASFLGATGIDINRYAIDTARKHYPQTDFIHGDITGNRKLVAKLKKAEVIVSLNMIEHLTDFKRERLFNKILPRITKKDAILIISLYRQYFLPNLINTILKRGTVFDPTHVHNWTRRQFALEVRKYCNIIEMKNLSGYTRKDKLMKYFKSETLIIAKLKNHEK